MDEKDLKLLGAFIAEGLIEQALKTKGEDWVTEDSRDHIIGELARCVTLQNIFLDREEYEKCAAMKLKIDSLASKLDFDVDFDPTDFQDGDEL
tara:strand:+ start:2136 stop:2414 length:279 start_codon:yes stop_codon:yes gene_type:complete